MKRDYYAILGVAKNASQTEIKSAYRRLALEWHPDKWSGQSQQAQKEAAERFKEINEAHRVLSVMSTRAMYDRYGHAADQQVLAVDLEGILTEFCQSNGLPQQVNILIGRALATKVAVLAAFTETIQLGCDDDGHPIFTNFIELLDDLANETAECARNARIVRNKAWPEDKEVDRDTRRARRKKA